MVSFRKKVSVVYLPESHLLDTIRSAPKFDNKNSDVHLEKAKKNHTYFKTHRFWEKDIGYKFVESALFPLLTTKCKLLDVGCSVGPLPEYLIHSGLWGKVEYHGVDINECAISVARAAYPEGDFRVCDLQSETQLVNLDFEVVFEKGTIISSYYPYKVLERLLALKAKYVLFVHCPFSIKSINTSSKYISALNISPESLYLISIMDERHFVHVLKTHGYIVEKWDRRKDKIEILNSVPYRLNDILVKKVN